MDIEEIEKYLLALNDKLKVRNVLGELGICGGAAMCLVFKARVSTKDIDGIFCPTQEIRQAIKEISNENNLPEDWLNDGVKGFFHGDPPKQEVREYSNLRIWSPSAEYMLAMKCVSARYDSMDGEDIEFLLKHLNIKDKDTVFNIICKYYPENSVPVKTKFVIEEIFTRLRQDS
ncbi:MAG TPA: hypothetical protein DET40_22445 [Lentisphaeria bacterium]|nr:MAG: hypothetical protein A2X45_24705 [Lentisphaerae bacterium GWF2_50_93]HCE46315.1 hypothetical protein [Lentisphaeria bacterium]